MSDAQIIAFFKMNEALFNNNTIAGGIIGWMGWGILKGVVWIADKCEILYDMAYKMVDFTAWGNINSYVDALKPLFIAIMSVSLLALGIILILNHEKKPKIMINICIAALCVTCSTVVFQQMNTITQDLKEGFESIGQTSVEKESVYDIVSDNLIDIVYLDQSIGMKNINYSNKESFPTPKVTKSNIDYIDYTEVMNPKSEYDWNPSGDAADILSKKVLFINTNGTFDKAMVRDVYNGFGWNSTGDADLANEYYYRYHFNFFTAILALAAIILIYVAMSYKCIRIAFELVVARLFAYLYSAELSGGQKIAKVLCFIRDSYILLLTTVLCIRIFFMMNAFIVKYVDNSFVRGIFILFVAFSIIDGPNLVEKLLGMDAGLKSSTARLMAAYGATRAAVHSAMAPIRFAAGHAGGKDTNIKNGSEKVNDFSKEANTNEEYMNDSEHNKSDSNNESGNNNTSSEKTDQMDSNSGGSGNFASGTDGENIADKMDKMDEENGRMNADSFDTDMDGAHLDDRLSKMDDDNNGRFDSVSASSSERQEQDLAGQRTGKTDDKGAGQNRSTESLKDSSSDRIRMPDQEKTDKSFMDEKRKEERSSFKQRDSKFKSELFKGGKKE